LGKVFSKVLDRGLRAAFASLGFFTTIENLCERSIFARPDARGELFHREPR
jgi:hypothetical protein